LYNNDIKVEQRQLLNFLNVCEEKNITKAAERRFITRQGLSKSLRELEEELEVKLFERSQDGVELTEYGKILEAAARDLIKNHDYILETIRGMKEMSDSRLFVGIEDSDVCSFSNAFFNDFLNAHPEIDLSIRTIDSKTCQKYLLKQKFQISITAPPFDMEKFDYFLLGKRKFNLVVGKSHRLAGRNSVKLEELRGEETITRHYLMDQEDHIGKFCMANGIKINMRLNFLDKNLIMELLGTGRYVFFCLETFFNGDDFHYIEIEDSEIQIEFYLIVNKRTLINSAMELFIAWTREQCACLYQY